MAHLPDLLPPSTHSESAPAPTVGAWLAEAAAVDGDDLVGLAEETQESEQRSKTTNTQRTYKYWFDRFTLWCQEPDKRWRMQNSPPLDLAQLLPVTVESEAVLSMWLHDMCLGPKDPDDREAWMDAGGPMAPNTLYTVIAAVRYHIERSCGVGWSPSRRMADVLKGLRRRLRSIYGDDRQAHPLLDRDVSAIARRLHVQALGADPDLARQNLVLELTAAGLTPAEIARLRADALQHRSAHTESHVTAPGEESQAGRPVLVIPGQLRRGGHRDPGREIRPEDVLVDALGAHAAARNTDVDAADALIDLAPTNPRSHVRNLLARLAERARVTWRPTAGTPCPPPDDLAAMRDTIVTLREFPSTDQIRNLRDLAMLLTGYLCALRRSELTKLELRDVVRNPQGLVLKLRETKTSQERTVHVGLRRTDGGLPDYLDAVAVLERWIEVRRHLAGDDDPRTPLFCALSPGGGIRSERISDQAWSDRLRELASLAEVLGPDASDDDYKLIRGHSLRRGFVTQAILNDVGVVEVAKHTRHSNLQMLSLYADQVLLLEGTNMTDLVLGTSSSPSGEAIDLTSGVLAA